VSISSRTRQIVRAVTVLVRDAGGTLPLPTLMTQLSAALPLSPTEILTAEIGAAATDGLLHIVDSAVTVPCKEGNERVADPDGRKDAQTIETSRSLRAVVVDVESVVRLDPDAPEYRDARIWQIGAVRLSADAIWEQADQRFSRYITLPDGWREELRSPAARAAVAEHGAPVADVLEAFRDFCADADALVAYNGISVDFPLLDAASEREGLPTPSGLRVDAYYLALAQWPFPPRSHRLAELAADVGVCTAGLRWHDAGDDAELTARLLRHAATTLTTLPGVLVSLLAATTHRSITWRLVRELAAGGVTPAPTAHNDAAVSTTLIAAFGHLPVRRDPAGAGLPGIGPLTVPEQLRVGDRTSPTALAAVVAGAAVEARPAQEEMAALLSSWLPDTDGAVEAATGTGKSLAVLAVALDHLAASPAHRVVIATHTRQLQAQLAGDVALLGGTVPGLLDLADVVKGAANRLSIRALVTALADTTAAATADTSGDSTPPRLRRSGYAEDVGYAELLALVVLRLHHAHSHVQQWVARSIDSADLPVFLTEYLPARFGGYLASLSQSNGEYPTAVGLAERTDTVADAIGGHRLVLANHALLLSHLNDFTTTGADTLLLIDEAHTLEGAATDALTSSVELIELEGCLHAASAWLHQHARPGRETERVSDAVDALRMLCDAEQLPEAMGKLLDQRASRPLGSAGPGRVATLASPFGSEHGEDRARAVTLLVQRSAYVVGDVASALWAYLAAPAGTGMDWFSRERTRMLATRLSTLEAAARTIVDHATTILGSVAPAPVTGTSRVTVANPVAPVPVQSNRTGATANLTRAQAQDRGSSGNSSGIGMVDGVDNDAADAEALEAGDVIADPDEDDPDNRAGGSAQESTDAGDLGSDADRDAAIRTARVLTDVSNRVVYVTEDHGDTPAATRRLYRAAVSTAPVELQLDHVWQQFRVVFARTFLTSATLRVAGGWEFLRRRLALLDLAVASLGTPFDLRSQARLVAFSDFPSWAEHSAAAVHTIAHQLTGYAREITHGAGAGAQVVHNGGALVLTTARRSAADIALHLARSLAADAAATGAIPVPVHAAGLVGNRLATDALATRGGICVGTKGLWAGVDIKPAERLNLVWINKLPFASANDPVIAARRAAVAAAEAEAGAEDPDLVATETYYLPLAALELRQAVGRLVRSSSHTGVIVISDRKLTGDTRQRRTYRRIFLESLDEDLHEPDRDTGEPCGGNVMPMTDGWARIWDFLATKGLLDSTRAATLSTPNALEEHALLPQTRRIRHLALTTAQRDALVAADSSGDTLVETILARSAEVGGLLNLSDTPLVLKDEQKAVIDAAARGHDVLAVLPTGFGKSYTFQLPALVSPGVTLVISPLVALMTDQALELNKTIGGAVRALVAPMTESVSRLGKSEVADQLTGQADHGIKLIYLSPERLCQRRMQSVVEAAVANGTISRIAVDEAHTFVQWGDDFRPSFRRLELYLARMRATYGLPLTAVTATATRSVVDGLRTGLLGLPALPAPDPGTGTSVVPNGRADTDPDTFTFVAANPLRTTLALYKRTFPVGAGGPVALAGLVERVVDTLDGHAILYCLTVREVDALAAALRAYVGDTGTARVLRFHSRLSEAEKQAVVFTFREAPSVGEDGYLPMIVVATSAFGLGIDRADVRCVTAVSPPTDLAALYQQLGRAGRDGQPATGITLATGRSLRTVAFFADLGLSVPTMVRIGSALLRLGVGVTGSGGGTFGLNVDRLATDCLTTDLATGAVTAATARRPGTAESYRIGVLRALAALAADGVIDDRGDYPTTVAILPGERPCPEADLAPLVVNVLGLAAAQPRGVTPVAAAHAQLRTDPNWAALADDPGATWNLFASFHDRGWLDVSQAPCRGRTHTCLAVPAGTSTTVPATFTARIGAHRVRAQAELRALRAFLAASTCLNTGFADYLASTDPGVCTAGPTCRCSVCWGNHGAKDERRPTLLDAVLTPRPRPRISRNAPHRLARLDEQVRTLLWDVSRGLSVGMLALVLKGGDTYFSLRTGTRRPLWPQLLYHRLRGVDPAIRIGDVEAALERLQIRAVAVNIHDTVWRLQRHIDRETAGAAARAGAAT
jgi:Rad3-related DNA helicase/DNA polymerase III epsilon subunit-like protein